MKKFWIVLIINVFLLVNIISYYSDNIFKVYYLDIGQGDASLIITPDKQIILIDGGPDMSVLERLGDVLPVWIRRINLIIITHPHADHIGGIVKLINRYQVDKVVFNRSNYKSPLVDLLNKGLLENNLPSEGLYQNEQLVVGCCVKIKNFWPNKTFRDSDANNISVATLISYKNFDIFAAGDLSQKYEEEIVNKNQLLDVEVLKVGHHGSRTSTSENLLNKIKPDIAVISCGKDNQFKHPHSETLNKLDRNRITTLRTDQLGTISIYSDGNNFWY